MTGITWTDLGLLVLGIILFERVIELILERKGLL